MTSPKLAHASDNGRYYTHPVSGESWPSVTNVLGTAINKPALVPWAAKVTAEHVLLERLPYYTRKLRTDRDGALKEAKAQVRFVKDTAAELGTRIHAHAEAHVLGKATVDDEEVVPYAAQLVEFFERARIDFDRDIEAAEATILNRTHGYAGTGDLWVWLRLDPETHEWGRKRHLFLIDYKSSATRPANSVYPEHGMQVAALAHAEHLLLDDGTEVAPPGPIAGTAVLNLRQKSHALIPAPADRDAAFAAFCAALEVTRYLHGITEKPVVVDAPPRLAPVTEKAS